MQWIAISLTLVFGDSTDLCYDGVVFLSHDNSQFRHCTKFYLCNIEKISKYKTAPFLQRSELPKKFYWARWYVSPPSTCHFKGLACHSEQWFCVLYVATYISHLENSKL